MGARRLAQIGSAGLTLPVEVAGETLMSRDAVRTATPVTNHHAAGAQPGHRFPAPGGSGRTRTDTKARQFEFRRASADLWGHPRTCNQHGSGPWGPGFKSRAPDQFCIQNRRFRV